MQALTELFLLAEKSHCGKWSKQLVKREGPKCEVIGYGRGHKPLDLLAILLLWIYASPNGAVLSGGVPCYGNISDFQCSSSMLSFLNQQWSRVLSIRLLFMVGMMLLKVTAHRNSVLI